MKQHITVCVVLSIALLGLNLWAWSVLDDQRVGFAQAQSDLIVCRKLTDRIKRLKDKPMIAGSHEIELTELSKRIEDAATGCQIPHLSLVRISPEASRRLGDSFYLEKPTTVVMEEVSLGQLAQFLFTMSSGPAAMNVRSLRLTAPREEETGDRWTAEITLSYLIYAPQQENGSSGPSSVSMNVQHKLNMGLSLYAWKGDL